MTPPAPRTSAIPDRSGADPFGTAGLREAVLAAWAASAARFREDANAEEDLVLGGYRDRVVVELAQNAADAAARAGEPGRLRLTLTPDELRVSNTGADLDAAGVESLSTLRASAKRGDESTVGRFGVGFAAVLALTDAPSIRTHSGAVGWAAHRAHELAASLPGLADEIETRSGQVPVLRLPFVAAGQPEEGFATTVVLPLRSEVAYERAHRLLDDVDVSLLLSLPALVEVEVVLPGATRVLRATREGDAVTVEDGGEVSTWRLAEQSGRHDDEALADRPFEERSRPFWSVTCAVPLRDGRVAALPPSLPRVVHAPTPTDEPLDLPVLLIASFPLDPTRRHVAPGGARAAVVAAASDAYADLVSTLAADGVDGEPLVPGPLAAGALDGELRAEVLDRLSRKAFLTGADGGLVAPRDAAVLDPPSRELARALINVVPGLALARDARQAERLGARRLTSADVVDAVAGRDAPPSWWRDLYAALEPLAADPGVREDLGGLPVPLADGRTVTGPRGLLTGLSAAGLEPLGLRVVHPVAAHPLLLRLGAVEASPAALLADPAVRALVEELAHELDAASDGLDPAEADPVVDAVLGLVDQSGVTVEDEPWLGDLPLATSEAGEHDQARYLVLPGTVAAALFDAPAPAESLLARWGDRVLTAVGVRTDVVVTRDHDVDLDTSVPVDDHDYAEHVHHLVREADPPVVVSELLLLDTFDLAEGQDLALLQHLSSSPLRSALLAPTRAVDGRGRAYELPSAAAWRLRHELRLDGRPIDRLALGRDPRLAGLYPVADVVGVDDDVLRAVGLRTSLEGLLAEPGGADDLLARLADVETGVSADQLAALYAALADVPADAVDPPRRLRVAPDLVADAADVVVADGPHLLALPWPTPPLVVPADLAAPLADLLDVDLASERAGRPEGGEVRDVPAVLARVLGDAPTTWREHDELVVDGHEVDWWVDGPGSDALVHAATLDGLARGLAWAAGAWSRRFLVAAVLAEPDRVDALLAEAAFD